MAGTMNQACGRNPSIWRVHVDAPARNFARVFYQGRLGVLKASSALSRSIGSGQGSFGVVFAQGSL